MERPEVKQKINELFQYKNGSLYWKTKLNNQVKKHQIAGTTDKKGYRCIIVDGKAYKEHRLIYKMFHDHIPDQVDHINGIRNDNCINNLRE